MDEQESEYPQVREASVDRIYLGRIIAVGTVVLWLVTMLLVLGPAAARGLF